MTGPGKVPPAKVALGTWVRKTRHIAKVQTNLRGNPSGAITLFAISSSPLVASMTPGELDPSDLVRIREPGLDTRETASNERETERRTSRDVNENACILSASRIEMELRDRRARGVVENDKFHRSNSAFCTLERSLSS